MECVHTTKLSIIINNLENNEELLKETLNNFYKVEQEGNVDFEIVVIQKEKNMCQYEKLNVKLIICQQEKDIYYTVVRGLDSDFVAFINAGDKYSTNFLQKFQHYVSNFPKTNIFVMPVVCEDGKYTLNSSLNKESLISLGKNESSLWNVLSACLITRKLLLKLVEPKYTIKIDMDKKVLFDLFALNGTYIPMKSVSLISAKILKDNLVSKEYMYEIEWYEEIFAYWEYLFEELIEKYNAVPIWFQKSFLYELYLRIFVNINTSDKHVLKNEKYDEFIVKLRKALNYINDTIIMQNPCKDCVVNPQIKFWLLKLKYNKVDENMKYREYKNEVILTFNDIDIFCASEKKLAIYLMDNRENTLILSGIYAFPFDTNKMRIYAEYAGEKYYAKTVKRYSAYKVFGKIIYTNYAYDIEVPLSLPDYKNELRFYLETGKSTVNLDLTYSKPMSKLQNDKASYWCFKKFILYPRSKRIMVLKKRKKRLIKKELAYLKKLFFSKNKVKKDAAILRIVYFLTRPFFKKKKIWIFFDKMYKAGDNAEYLYKYSLQQEDEYKKYYVLRNDVPDSKRFKKEKIKFLKYGSLKHKLVFLNSKVILATHCNVSTFNTFNKTFEKYFRDLFRYDVICISHGLTVQSIPHNQNRIVDNTKLYPVPTYIEKENIDNEEYDYKGKNIVTLSGMSRYDGLINNDKKQILITPTWRTYLAIPSQTGKARGYNNIFKQTNYFKIYNNLINNKKLIDKAKEKGYGIVYLLHPVTSSQISDYEQNGYVKIVAATDNLNYEKILTESSLMVTDYSGVQFDFAYMYKPVVYFHPDELPASYDEGAYKYETMALGEIIKTTDELVDKLCEYMDNNCNIKSEYKERIDKFFVHHDHNNCKRIYEDIINYCNNKKNI